LLKVRGLTPSIYELLTGNKPPEFSAGATVGQLLGFEDGVEPTLKEVTERIIAWPDVVGCVLGSDSGLPVAGTVPAPLDARSLVAYCPKLFHTVNASFKEFAGVETDELVVPQDNIGFIFMRNQDTYLVTLMKRRELPNQDMHLLRQVLFQIATKHKSS
jgi:predicted regulator of Ras-like GTPase activity (Roadblock/LC7/MglB family)